MPGDGMSSDLLFPISGVERIKPDLAANIVTAHHYLHRAPSISFAFGLWEFGQLVGVATYGIPGSRNVQRSVCPSDPDTAIELNRLWVHDEQPRNTESRFVAQTLRDLPPRLIFSYADTSQGHIGYVYRALNFNYAGWTDMDRKTPRFDYLPHDPKKHPRESSRSGHSDIAVYRSRKAKYWIATGNRSERKNLKKICGWPVLSWRDYPIPELDNGYGVMP